MRELHKPYESKIFGFEKFSRFVLLLGTLVNVYIAAVVESKFRELYTDAIPGQNLGFWTSLVLNYQPLFIATAALWSVTGFSTLFFTRRPKNGIIAGCVIAAGIQVGFTVFALSMPFNKGPIVGLSSSL